MNDKCTTLNDRVLWFDGDSSFHPELIYKQALNGNNVSDFWFVTECNSDIEQYNRLVTDKKLQVKSTINDLDFNWNIPDSYKNVNLKKYINNKLIDEITQANFNDNETSRRMSRVALEYDLYKKYNVIELLKTIIYIIDTFNDNNVVWGTGRGSSCSSYILYLIGLHEVDSVMYDLDIHEFFR